MIAFDHLAVSGQTLTQATDYVESALGVPLQQGGQHAVFHTHNMLLGLEDGLYLEAIAINPDAPKPDRARWFALDDFSGPARLSNWICCTADIAGTIQKIDLDMGAPVSLHRGDLRWQMAVPDTGRLPFDNCAPALIQWQSNVHPWPRLTPQGIRLIRFTVRHPKADVLKATLPIRDDRIAFETGSASLHAAFETPHGPREIGP